MENQNLTSKYLNSALYAYANEHMDALERIYNHYEAPNGETINEPWIGDGAIQIDHNDVHSTFGPIAQAMLSLMAIKRARINNVYFVNDHIQQFVSFKFYATADNGVKILAPMMVKVFYNYSKIQFHTQIVFYDENNGQMNMTTNADNDAIKSMLNAYNDLMDKFDSAY